MDARIIMFISRQDKILEFLKTKNLATVDDLVEITGASPATIRRDLIKLDNAGLVYRVHGSVSLKDSPSRQPTTSEKQRLHHEQKLRIAEKAASLVKAGDSVLFDAGTTTIEIARKLMNVPLKVITTDLHIGALLADVNSESEVTLTGGTIDNSSQSCIGDKAREVINSVHPTFTFLSCNAWDLRFGITAPTIEKANLKRDLAHIISHKVLVADSSKYGKSQLYEVAKLREIDTIITDDDLPQDVAANIIKLGVELILV